MTGRAPRRFRDDFKDGWRLLWELAHTLRRVNAPWLSPPERQHRCAALVVTFAVWSVGWATATFRAAAHLTNTPLLASASATGRWYLMLDQVCPAIPAIVLGLAILPHHARQAALSWSCPTPGSWWRGRAAGLLPNQFVTTRSAGAQEVAAFHVPSAGSMAGALWVGAFFAGVALGVILLALTGSQPTPYPYPPDPDAFTVAIELISSVLAGPTEEIVFGAVMVTVMRRGGWSWAATIAIIGGLRWVFHIYYGWQSVAMLVWGCLGVAGYALTGNVLVPALLHSLWDVQGTLLSTYGAWGGVATVLVFVTYGLAGAAGMPSRVRPYGPRQSPPRRMWRRSSRFG